MWMKTSHCLYTWHECLEYKVPCIHPIWGKNITDKVTWRIKKMGFKNINVGNTKEYLLALGKHTAGR